MEEATQISEVTAAQLRALLAPEKVPGCAIGVTTSTGAIGSLFVGEARLRPHQAVQARSHFHLFSGTKVYTAAAVMLLVERGLLSLDDGNTQHLPELPLRYPISVRQLASHSSGLADTLRAFLAVHSGDRPPPSTAEALDRYRIDRGRPPGNAGGYRNVNFAILGELVSRLSGQPYEVFVHEAVLRPLGANLKFSHAHEDSSEMVCGHLPRWSPMRFALPLLLPEVAAWIFERPVQGFVPLHSFGLDTAAIGGLIGPVEAFLPMLREMLSERDGLLRTTSKRIMLTRHSNVAAGVVSREGVGIGWKLGRKEGAQFWNHEGGGPGFCSETRLYPDAGLGIVILMNRSQSSALSRVCHRICERLRADLSSSTAAESPCND